MRMWGRVYSNFWTRPKTGTLSDAAKLLALYCLAGPHSNGVGCFRLPPAYVAEDLHWDAGKVVEALKELEAVDFLAFCKKTQWVFLKRFLVEQPPENPNVAKSFKPFAQAVPQDTTFYPEFVEASKVISDRLPEWSLNGLPNGYRNREPEPEPDPQPQPKTKGRPELVAGIESDAKTVVPDPDGRLIWLGDEEDCQNQLLWLRQILPAGVPERDQEGIVGMTAAVDRGKTLSKPQEKWVRDLYVKHKSLVVAESKRRVEGRHPGISAAVHDPTHGKAICAAITKRDDDEVDRLLRLVAME